MRAEIRRFHSPDVHDLVRWAPPDPACFGFLLQVLIGPADSVGEESFDFVVCTPDWLRRKHGERAVILPRHHVQVFTYDFQAIDMTLRSFVSSVEGASWQDLANELSRYGKWEFEDYKEEMS
jgi:hypothetical protein